MTTTPIRFNTRPSLIMSGTVKWPEPKTTAFGAVATGSMNAQLALSAAGSITTNGSISFDDATDARIGMIKIVLAVLLVISVRKVIKRQTRITSAKTGRVPTPLRTSAISPLSPEISIPFAKQIPPLKSNRTPQGRFLQLSQSSSRPSCPSRPLPSGIRNKLITPTKATEASLAPCRPSHSLHPPKGSTRVIHANEVSPKTIKVRLSAGRHGPTSGRESLITPLCFRPNHNHIKGSIIMTTGTP